jgi:hypothetical protein
MGHQKIIMRITTGALAIIAAQSTFAEAQVYPQNDCTWVRHASAPPPFDETTLGGEVDKLAYVGERFRVNISRLKKDKWTFAIGEAGLTDRDNKKIYIQNVASNLTLTSGLSHEVGHAMFNPEVNYSTKDDYIASMCGDEARAIYENVIDRRVILGCPAEAGGGADIGIQASQPWDIYIDMVDNPETLPFNYAKLGMAFCQNNINSVTKQPYFEYYGDWYDEHFPSGGAKNQGVPGTPPSLPQTANDEFWSKIQQLSEAAHQNMEKLVSKWPSQDLHEAEHVAGERSGTFNGGRYSIGNIAVSNSAIITRPDGAISHAFFSVEGVCIRRLDIEPRYPDLVITDVPKIPSLPYTLSAFRSWGRIGFMFNAADDCLARVYFDPHPMPFFDPDRDE